MSSDRVRSAASVASIASAVASSAATPRDGKPRVQRFVDGGHASRIDPFEQTIPDAAIVAARTEPGRDAAADAARDAEEP